MNPRINQRVAKRRRDESICEEKGLLEALLRLDSIRGEVRTQLAALDPTGEDLPDAIRKVDVQADIVKCKGLQQLYQDEIDKLKQEGLDSVLLLYQTEYSLREVSTQMEAMSRLKKIIKLTEDLDDIDDEYNSFKNRVESLRKEQNEMDSWQPELPGKVKVEKLTLKESVFMGELHPSLQSRLLSMQSELSQLEDKDRSAALLRFRQQFDLIYVDKTQDYVADFGYQIEAYFSQFLQTIFCDAASSDDLPVHEKLNIASHLLADPFFFYQENSEVYIWFHQCNGVYTIFSALSNMKEDGLTELLLKVLMDRLANDKGQSVAIVESHLNMLSDPRILLTFMPKLKQMKSVKLYDDDEEEEEKPLVPDAELGTVSAINNPHHTYALPKSPGILAAPKPSVVVTISVINHS